MKIDWQFIISKAWERRSELIEANDSDSLRLFHGYEEGCKGVVIEKFGPMAVIEFKVDIRDQLPQIADALLEKFPFKLIVSKGHQCLKLKDKDRIFPVIGKWNEAPEFAHEFGRKYHLTANTPHSYGLYLDARPVRRWLSENSEGRRVLNLFAFTGSLGVAAASSGATEVVHLDKSRDLVPRIKASYQANDLDFDDRSFLRGDIYKHLPKAIKSGQRFDGIILDPPPRVYQSPYAAHRPNGQDFPALVKMCSQLLNPGGWLISLFHRFDVTLAEFEEQVVSASEQTVAVKQRFTSDIDFPESNPEHKLRVSVFHKQN
ncbi:MAG: class I SAM-dependent methyltransferase [Pseudobacteriovorax sp.]|nr:class I SAM-dependent methyltransferase [Pseudobacteriovorax sp.]